MTAKNGTLKVATVVALGLISGGALALGPLGAGRAARADDTSKATKKERKPAKPRITGVNPEEALAGGPIVIVGTGFSIFANDGDLDDMPTYREAMKAVSATVADEPALVQSVSDTEVQIQLPFGLKKGKVKVELTVDGKSASTSVTVLDESAREEKRKADQNRETQDTPPSADFLALDPPAFSVDRGQQQIAFTGKADGLPDGCVIALKLTFGPEDVDTAAAEVKAGRFGGKFGPYQKSLFAGKYWVDAMFRLDKQSVDMRKKFAKAFEKDAVGAKQHDHAGARLPVRVGGLDAIAEQTRELKTSAAAACVKAREMLAEIAVAYGSAGRSGFVTGGKVDEAAWEAWLEKRAYTAIPSGERAKRLKEMQLKRDFLGGGSAFSDARWREFIDGKRDEMKAQLKEHEAYRARFLVVRDAEGIRKIGELWIQLQDVAILWSRELYENARVPPDAKDPKLAGKSAGQILKDIAWLEAHSWEPPPDKD